MENYNGYKNYFTWNLKLWMDNDEHSYNAYRAAAREIIAENPDKLQAVGVLADQLKNGVEESAPELEPSFYCDILTAAIDNVDFFEIAEEIITELLEE